MTVAELIEKLQQVSPDLLVSVEGCDCAGDAMGISFIPSGLLIRRDEGTYTNRDGVDELELL